MRERMESSTQNTPKTVYPRLEKPGIFACRKMAVFQERQSRSLTSSRASSPARMQLKDGADAHGISAGRSTFTLLEETLVGTDGGIGQLGRVGAVRKVAVSLADVHMVKQIGAHKMDIALVMIPGQTNCQQYLATAARIMAADS